MVFNQIYEKCLQIQGFRITTNLLLKGRKLGKNLAYTTRTQSGGTKTAPVIPISFRFNLMIGGREHCCQCGHWHQWN